MRRIEAIVKEKQETGNQAEGGNFHWEWRGWQRLKYIRGTAQWFRDKVRLGWDDLDVCRGVDILDKGCWTWSSQAIAGVTKEDAKADLQTWTWWHAVGLHVKKKKKYQKCRLFRSTVICSYMVHFLFSPEDGTFVISKKSSDYPDCSTVFTPL